MITPIRQLEILHSRQEGLGFQLHSLSQKPSSPRAQDIRQRILELFGLTQVDNIGISVHGVSLSSRGSGMLDTRLDTPPSHRRRHPVPVIALTMSAIARARTPPHDRNCGASAKTEVAL